MGGSLRNEIADRDSFAGRGGLAGPLIELLSRACAVGYVNVDKLAPLYYLFKYVAYLHRSALHACCIALYIVSFFLSLRCAMLYIALLPSVTVREGAVSDFFTRFLVINDHCCEGDDVCHHCCEGNDVWWYTIHKIKLGAVLSYLSELGGSRDWRAMVDLFGRPWPSCNVCVHGAMNWFQIAAEEEKMRWAFVGVYAAVEWGKVIIQIQGTTSVNSS